MNSHDVTILGYVVFVLAALVLEGLATWTRGPVPSLEAIFARVMRSRTGRVGMLVAWAWLGLHFFAR